MVSWASKLTSCGAKFNRDLGYDVSHQCANFHAIWMRNNRELSQNRFLVSAFDLCTVWFSFTFEPYFEHHFGNPRELDVKTSISSENRQRASQQHSQQPRTVGFAIGVLQIALGTCEVRRDVFPIAPQSAKNVTLYGSSGDHFWGKWKLE